MRTGKHGPSKAASPKAKHTPATPGAPTGKEVKSYAKAIIARGGVAAVNKRRAARGVKPLGNKVKAAVAKKRLPVEPKPTASTAAKGGRVVMKPRRWDENPMYPKRPVGREPGIPNPS